ncbi:MAG: hypothetical protein JW822_10835 [Spirochaetales bacterium]|nr:hypothetical protein [Spirochaetales bacterium]
MNNRLALSILIFLFLSVVLWAQTSSQIPAGADNYLQVTNSLAAGGLDSYLVIFFEIPATETSQLYFAINDPDIHFTEPDDFADSTSAHSAWSSPPANPRTTFYLVGRGGALSHPDSKIVDYAAAGVDPLGPGMGTILHQFTNTNTATDEGWVYFPFVFPEDGEEIGNKYYFKIVVHASSDSDWIKNGFQADVSYNNSGSPTGVANTRSFAYSWSVYLKDTNSWDLNPFVPDSAVGNDIAFWNWDMDGGEQLSAFDKAPETGLAAPIRSGDSSNKYADARQGTYTINAGEENGTWRLRITEDNVPTVGDNVNTAEFWFTDGAANSNTVYRAYSQPSNDPPSPDHVLISADDGVAPTGGGANYEPINLQIVDAGDNPVDYIRQVTVIVSGSAEIAEINGVAQAPGTQNATFNTNGSGQAFLEIVDNVEETATVQVSWAWGTPGNDSVPVTFNNNPTPFITDRFTVDRDSDGYIDAVRIVFNTAIDDATVPPGTPSGYAITGAGGLDFNSTTGGLDTADDNDIYITFTDGALGSGSTPNVSYARPPGTTQDSGANFMLSQTATAAVDRAGPAVISAQTYTTTVVQITFSENVSDATVGGGDFIFSGFTTAGANGAGTGFDTGVTPNDNIVLITLAAVIDTDETGSVRLNAVGAVQDAAGNNSAQTALVAVSDGIITLEDVVPQKGDVAIVNNVINPTAGEQARLLYLLESDGNVKIQVFNLAGDIVAVLLSGRQTAGEYDVFWDGRNSGGNIVAKGIYFIRIVAPGIDETRKVLVVK